jgi:hypothetical protein
MEIIIMELICIAMAVAFFGLSFAMIRLLERL